MKLKKLLAIILSLATLSCSSTAFASSVGSVTNDPSIGEDTVQGAYTEYENVGTGNTQTDVYLTVDNSNIRVGVPTVIILDGTPNENGEYIGNYSVRTEGDMSGDSTLIVQPKSDTVTVSQTGKNDMSATINQMQTAFTAEEVAAGATTTGTATAIGLTAGSWNGTGSFEIGINSTSTASIEYFTWGEDAEFMSAYESSDLSDYPGLTVAEENENSNYSYPDATAITGLTDEGIEWIQSNNGRLILPTFATSIADSTNSGLDSAFGRWNRTYGPEINELITYVYSPENINYIGSYAFVGLENVAMLTLNAKTLANRSLMSCWANTINLNGKCRIIEDMAVGLCPELENVLGTNNVISVGHTAFAQDYKLESLDLSACETIGYWAFYCCYELNTVNPTDALQSIGDWAFFHSDCNDDFSVLENCNLGTYATTSQRWANGVPEYTFKPCKNKITGFNQDDPRWADTKIANTNKTYGQSGCGWCCVATVYNYYNNTSFTPVDIVNMVYETNPSLIGDGAYTYGNNEILTVLGLTNGNKFYGSYASDESGMNQSTDLQSLMDGLANGYLAHLHMANIGFQGRHGIIAYGITDDGELMCVSSDYQMYAGSDPDKTSTTGNGPQYFTLKPEHILMSCDGYEIISKG